MTSKFWLFVQFINSKNCETRECKCVAFKANRAVLINHEEDNLDKMKNIEKLINDAIVDIPF